MRAKRRNLIKIGFSKDVAKRAVAIRSEVRSNIFILATTDGGRAEEREMHARFDHLRRRGEWFEPGDDLLDYIKHNATPWSGQELAGIDRPDEYWKSVARPPESVSGGHVPIAFLIVNNLLRLGFADIVVRSSELSALVAEKTGKPVSRQRISAIMNAVRVEPETIEAIAKGIGVKPAELTRKVRIKFE